MKISGLSLDVVRMGAHDLSVGEDFSSVKRAVVHPEYSEQAKLPTLIGRGPTRLGSHWLRDSEC